MSQSFGFFPSRLALAASVSLALLSGCAAPLATVPSGTVPAQAPAASAPASPDAPAPGAPVAPEAIAWTTLEGDASYMGEPLANAPLRVVDALTDAPAHLISAGGANVSDSSGLGARLNGRSGAIGVETDALKTDAQGHFSVRVAGLAPGQAVRLVVQAGDNALSALVLGGQAQPAGYRVQAALGVKISLPSTITSVASTGVLKATTVLKGAEAEAVRNAFVQQVGQVAESAPVTGGLTGTVTRGIIGQTDSKTGDAKKTEEYARYVQEQGSQSDEIMQRMKESLDKVIKLLQDMRQAKDEVMRGMTRVYRVRQAANPVGTATREQIKALVTQTLEVVREVPGLSVTPAQDIVGRVVAENPALNSDTALTSEQLAAVTASLGRALDAAAGQIQAAADAERARLEAEAAAKLAALEAAKARDLAGKELYQTSALTQLIKTAGVRAELVAANQKALVATVTAAQDPAKRASTSSTGSGAVTVTGVPLPGTGVTADLQGTTLSLTDPRGRRVAIDVTKPDDVAQATGRLAEVFSPPKSSGGHSAAAATPTPVSGMMSYAFSDTLGSDPTAIAVGPDAVWVLLPDAKQVLRYDNGSDTPTVFTLAETPTAIAPEAMDHQAVVTTATGFVSLAVTDGQPVQRSWALPGGNDATMIAYVGPRYDVYGSAPYTADYERMLVSNGTTVRTIKLYADALALNAVSEDVDLVAGATRVTGLSSAFAKTLAATNGPLAFYNETYQSLEAQSFGASSVPPLWPVTAYPTDNAVDLGAAGLSAAGELVRIYQGAKSTRSLKGDQPVDVAILGTTVWVAGQADGGRLILVSDDGAVAAYGLDGFVPRAVRVDAQERIWVIGDHRIARVMLPNTL